MNRFLIRILGTAAVCGGLAATFPARAADRAPDAILVEINAIKTPALDSSKREDREYIRQYLNEMNDAMTRKAELIGALYRADPENARLPALMPERWGALSQTTKDASDSAALSRELDEAFTRAKSPALKTAAAVWILRTARSTQTSRRQLDAVGKPFELAFTDAISGSEIAMKHFQGKVVVIDFWATWCGPCVAEMPKMKDLYAKYKDQGVEFIGVSLDQKDGGLDKLKEFVKNEGISWPQYFQGDGWNSKFSASWGINSIPAVFIADQDGKLHSVEARGKLETMIPELLNRPVPKAAGGAGAR